jgi:hypothetical protein
MPASVESSRVARFAYPLGLLLVLAPLLELAGRVWPLQWYLVQWRFQTELAILNASPVMLIGAFIIAAVAWAEESISTLKLLGMLLVTFGVIMLPVAVMLGVDGMQLRQMARSELRGPLRNNIIVSGLRALLAAAAAVALGIGATNAARSLISPSKAKRAAGSQPETESTTPLIIGQAP